MSEEVQATSVVQRSSTFSDVNERIRRRNDEGVKKGSEETNRLRNPVRNKRSFLVIFFSGVELFVDQATVVKLYLTMLSGFHPI